MAAVARKLLRPLGVFERSSQLRLLTRLEVCGQCEKRCLKRRASELHVPSCILQTTVSFRFPPVPPFAEASWGDEEASLQLLCPLGVFERSSQLRLLTRLEVCGQCEKRCLKRRASELHD